MTVFKNIIFTFVVPGTITVLIPYRLLTPSYTRFSFELGLFRYGGVLLMLLGAALYFWCRVGSRGSGCFAGRNHRSRVFESSSV